MQYHGHDIDRDYIEDLINWISAPGNTYLPEGNKYKISYTKDSITYTKVNS